MATLSLNYPAMSATRSAALVLVLFFFLVSSRCEWVDYPSGVRCCSKIPVDDCDPAAPDANSACRDVCHYGGCKKGGQCGEAAPGSGRFCLCNC